ncbi:hypothetical protein ABFX02_14G018500 [Erythranthe guttata]
MENFTHFRHILTVLAFAIIMVVEGQQSNSSSNMCTGPMIRSFSSCIGFLSGGSKSSSPTSACCRSLKDLMINGQDCLCLIVTGGVPFQIPNRNLALSLPRACKMSGVPVECKATASPVPAPDPKTPRQSGPSISPGLSPPSPRAPFIPQPLTPPSPTPAGGGGRTPFVPPSSDSIPTMTPPGMRPTLTTSAAKPPSHSVLPISLLVAVLGFFLLK